VLIVYVIIFAGEKSGLVQLKWLHLPMKPGVACQEFIAKKNVGLKRGEFYNEDN
jgi:hypothetical protein